LKSLNRIENGKHGIAKAGLGERAIGTITTPQISNFEVKK